MWLSGRQEQSSLFDNRRWPEASICASRKLSTVKKEERGRAKEKAHWFVSTAWWLYFLGITILHHLLTLSFPEGSGNVKVGGGGNAREIRTRKTKKKGRKDEDSDEESGPLRSTFMATNKFIFKETQCPNSVIVCFLEISLFAISFCHVGRRVIVVSL